MPELIKNIFHRLLYSGFMRPLRDRLRDLIRREVNVQLPSYMLANYSQDQLFYDVANFVVYNLIPGDYLEFGVHNGQGLAKMYRYMQHHWLNYRAQAEHYGITFDDRFLDQKRFFAFDSFKGLPGSNAEDTPANFAQPGVFAASRQEFQATMSAQGVDQSKVVTIAGWFNQTLTRDTRINHEIKEACVIFVDCDLYESATTVFNFLTPMVRNGTVLIVDDLFRYGGDYRKGMQKAFRQWKASCPHIRTQELSRCGANRIAFVCHLDRDENPS